MLNFPSRVLQAVGGLLQPHTETETQTMFLKHSYDVCADHTEQREVCGA